MIEIKDEFALLRENYKPKKLILKHSAEELKFVREMIKRAEDENAKVYKYANRYKVR